MERRLRWYGHVECFNGAVKRAFDIQVDGKHGPGRPTMTRKQRGIAESGSSQISTLMIDLVWDLPCVQQASYLEGSPPMWMLPLYLHVNKKSDYDDIMAPLKNKTASSMMTPEPEQTSSMSSLSVFTSLPDKDTSMTDTKYAWDQINWTGVHIGISTFLKNLMTHKAIRPDHSSIYAECSCWWTSNLSGLTVPAVTVSSWNIIRLEKGTCCGSHLQEIKAI